MIYCCHKQVLVLIDSCNVMIFKSMNTIKPFTNNCYKIDDTYIIHFQIEGGRLGGREEGGWEEGREGRRTEDETAEGKDGGKEGGKEAGGRMEGRGKL